MRQSWMSLTVYLFFSLGGTEMSAFSLSVGQDKTDLALKVQISICFQPTAPKSFLTPGLFPHAKKRSVKSKGFLIHYRSWLDSRFKRGYTNLILVEPLVHAA